MLFNFTFFNIMDQADMVELLDGYTNQVVARFDGRNPPREIVNISTDFVILYFYSDRTNEAQGFSLVYQGTFYSVMLKIFIASRLTFSGGFFKLITVFYHNES